MRAGYGLFVSFGILWMFLGGTGVFAQEAPAAIPVEDAALPAGYEDIRLGMSFEELAAALTANPGYGYQGEEDVTMRDNPGEVLIETEGGKNSFFGRCWFQFYEGKLYIITLNLNPAWTDHYSVFTTLRGKYGAPAQLTPEKIVWENQEVIMSLERPLTLRYVDAPVFQQLLKNSALEQAASERLREQFLEGL
jgi:hypothetical protein